MSESNGLVLGIDFGTSSIKVLCASRSGRLRTVVQPYGKRAGADEDTPPEAWWQALQIAMRAMAARIDAGQILAIGLTAQVGTYLLEAPDGNVVASTTIGWRRGLGEVHLHRAKDKFPRAFFEEHISMDHPEMVSYPIPRILRYQDEMPETWRNADKLLQPKDYLYRRLTGICASDPYSWRGLANLTDGTFHEELLQGIGVSRDKLPSLYRPNEAPAFLLPEVAEVFGIPSGIPVFVGCNDFFSSLLGMGVIRSGQCFDVTGTSEHVGRITQRPDPGTGLIHGPYFQDSVHYGVTAGSGTCMSWAFRTFGRNPETVGKAVDLCESSARRLPLFLPYLQGERAPIFDSTARGVFFGLESHHDARDLTESVLEGVVFSLYHIWSMIAEEGATEIRVAGGAAFDDSLNRMKARLFQIPFSIMKEKESGSLGAAMSAAYGIGWFSSYQEAIDNWVEIDHVVQPDTAGVSDDLSARFKIYKSLYPALKGSFTSWAQLQGESEHAV